MYHEGRFFGFLKAKSHFPHIIETNLRRRMSGLWPCGHQDIWMKGFEGKGMYAWWNREKVVAVLRGCFLCRTACGVRLDVGNHNNSGKPVYSEPATGRY